MIGGKHTVQGTPTQLDPSTRPCRILTIRLNPGDSRIDFADSADGVSHGYLVATSTAGESWTFGPFGAGMGIKPSDIFIWGTANDELYWNGLEA